LGTFLAAPLRQQEQLIGTLNARRIEMRPFTPAQIKLLETFANQAVIAVENVRLFQELTESLEQQTATSEILRVIASSPTDLQPVLDVVAETAARLCDAIDSLILRVVGDSLRLVAQYGSVQAFDFPPFSRGFPAGRAVLDCQTIHVHDLAAEIETEYPQAIVLQQISGTRTVLVTPLLREGVAIGVIVIRRTEVRPFTDKQIALLETFADQAVIAIENVRLFTELEDRNRQLTEALEQQTTTSEILRVIATSPTDIQPVLNVVAENAARLCESVDARVFRVDDDLLRVVASYGPSPAVAVPVDRGSVIGRAVVDRQAIHIHDIDAESEAEFPESKNIRSRGGSTTRTRLAVPLLREGIAIGAIVVLRKEVRPSQNDKWPF
jgi:GAF domain-containing protein